MRHLSIRLDDTDFDDIAALAAHEFLSVPALVRKTLLGIARERRVGSFAKLPDAGKTQDKPKFKRLPIPNQGNVWNELIVLQLEQGKSHADIAEIYGTDVANIKAREKRGLEMREDAPEHIAQLLDDYYIELAESGQLEPDATDTTTQTPNASLDN